MPREDSSAGELAGLSVEEPLDEPEAAAIYFGISNLKEGERVLVCDLGGGTYDATVLAMKQGVLRAQKTRGSRELGGHDWTVTLVGLVAPRIAEQTGQDPRDDPNTWQRLYDLCEQAKRRLSTPNLEKVQLPWSQGGQILDLTVSREEYEAQCEPLMMQVIDKTSQALADAGLQMSDLTHVLIVGGSSRLPSFQKAIQSLTGKTPQKTKNPDEAVALGAALVARGYASGNARKGQGRISLVTGSGSKQTRITIQRTNPHALGTRVASKGPNGLEIISDTLIAENTDLPAQFTREYRLEPHTPTFQVPVIELDSHGETQAEIGTFRFKAPTGRTQASPIRVEFAIDANKTAVVKAFDALTSAELAGERTKYEEPKIVEVEVNGQGGPSTVVLAVDCSISMSGSKIQEARQAAREIARKYLDRNPQNLLAMVNFGGPSAIYPASVMVPPTRDLNRLEQAANQLQPDGGTPMEAGMEKVREILEQAPHTRVAIVLTDGQPNDAEKTRQLAQTLRAERILIGTIPIGSDADRNFLGSIGDLESNLKVDDQGRGMAAAVLDILSKI
ncbi:MAG: Hsp70 family protein [Gemmataceae bacterium]